MKDTLDKYTLSTDHTVGLYFCAGYCSWSTQFSELLHSVYPFLRTHDIEILAVASDKAKEEHDAYTSSMPWPAADFDDGQRVALRGKYSIKKIPTLVFVDRTGQIVEFDGRDLVVYAVKEEYDALGAAMYIAKNLSTNDGYTYVSDS